MKAHFMIYEIFMEEYLQNNTWDTAKSFFEKVTRNKAMLMN